MPERYRRLRFPIEVVEHCVWLYFHFSLSLARIEPFKVTMPMEAVIETRLTNDEGGPRRWWRPNTGKAKMPAAREASPR